MWSGAVGVPGAGVGRQMPLEAGAGRWSWDMCGMKRGVFAQLMSRGFRRAGGDRPAISGHLVTAAIRRTVGSGKELQPGCADTMQPVQLRRFLDEQFAPPAIATWRESSQSPSGLAWRLKWLAGDVLRPFAARDGRAASCAY